MSRYRMTMEIFGSPLWYAKNWAKQVTRSGAFRKAPTVDRFGSPSSKCSLDLLPSVNVLVPTRLCRIMAWYGSDKGAGWHNYTTIYSRLFREFQFRDIALLELGLGTNNPHLPSTMGVDGRPGASLRGWRDAFPRSRVYGADIDRNILFQDEKITTYYCDQLDRTAIGAMWQEDGIRDGVDILIEDGLHTFDANTTFLEESLAHLKPGGFYVIEDVATSLLPQWRERIESLYVGRFHGTQIAVVSIPNHLNSVDNNLIIIQRTMSPGGEL